MDFYSKFKKLLRNAPLCLMVLTIGVALSGCVSLSGTPKTPYSAAQQQQLLPNLKYWQAEGKIAFKMGDERQSASFQWQQHNKNYAVHIFGPFGHGSTWVKRTSHGVTLENAKLGNHRADSAEELMQTLVGWQVPVSNMQYWIKGQTAPDSKAETTLNNEGFIASLVQQGWQVSISSYQTVERWQLPQKIIATRDDMRIMVVIKQWQPKSSFGFL